MSNKRPFKCYFCDELIKNETEMGHTTLCSKVLISCPYNCGAYIQRANMDKHKTECVNNINNPMKTNLKAVHQQTSVTNTNSLDRNGISSVNKLRINNDVIKLSKKISELEARLNATRTESEVNDVHRNALTEIRNKLNQQSLTLEKINYYNNFLSEWKKNVDGQIITLKTTIASTNDIKKEFGKQWKYIQEKLIQTENLQMQLNLLKETMYKENTLSKKTEMDFARNIEDLKNLVGEQGSNLVSSWNEQSRVLDNTRMDVENIKQLFEEQKAKHASLIFDVRAISQISSEAAERVEIQERELQKLKQEVNQMRVDMDILEGLASFSDSDSGCFGGILWRITEVESKMARAKENDIVIKSPIFYSYRYGYKIRVLLYLNGLKKWKGRYALASLHVLKGEYDMLLNWPCTIEGNITLKDLSDISKPKNFSKYIKTRKTCGDEEDDEPQESSSTFIFIPHTTLLKDNFVKEDTMFLEIHINNNTKYETMI